MKYYYFKYPEGKLVSKFKADHNDVHVERGVWRKYNPYNPYVEGSEEGGSPNGGGAANSLESLDDLLADDPEEVNVASPILDSDSKNESSSGPIMSPEEQKEEEKRQAELIDIQKELEAKFDELFGSIDSDD